MMSAIGSPFGAVAIPISDPTFQRSASPAAIAGNKLRSVVALRQSRRKEVEKNTESKCPGAVANRVDQ